MRYRILGGVEVWHGDEPAVIPRPRHRAVLGYLLLNAGRVVTVEALTEAMWGGAPPATARAQLHADIAAIRRAGRGAGALPLETRPGGYTLRVGHDELDYLRFRALVSRARGEPPEAGFPLLREALGLWRGPALADAVGAYVPAARLQLDEERLAAREALLVDTELALGRHREAVPELWQAARDQPTRERLWCALMLALHRSGRRADALAAARELRRFLADEHGLEPGQAFLDTERTILRAGQPANAPNRPPAPEPPAPEPAAPEPAAPEPAAPRSEPAEPDEVAPPEAVTVPALLPPDIADFTGRRAELDQLDAALAPGDGDPGAPLRIVTITGMGGVGKTTLAVHAAHRAAGTYPDGQLYASLSGTDARPVESGEVLARFLRALGVDERAIPLDLTERADAYRSRMAGRRALVVLDDAADEGQVRPLLPGGGSCTAVVTSRSGLDGLEGAYRVQLDVFTEAEATTLLGRVAHPQRIAREPDESSAILQLCGRLPLAVRIAGARLRSRPAWPVSRLAAALRNEHRRLDHLVAGDLAVRMSLASSYRAIGKAGQRAARRLSLFSVPDFPSWLAAAVLDVPVTEAEDLLERLVDVQLLIDGGTDPTGRSRYRFHDLVRLYLREQAAREEPEGGAAVLRAGFGAYLWLARRMSERIPGPCYAAVRGDAPPTPVAGLDDLPDALDWFAVERAGLLAVVRHACDEGAVELAFDLAGCLEKYFDIRGMYIDWRAANECVLRACRAAGHRLGEAVMLRGLIELETWHEGNHPGAAMHRMHRDAERLAALFAEVGHGPGMSDAAVDAAWALAAQGRYADAAARAADALRLAEAHGHLGGQARAHVAHAVVSGESLALDEAERHLTVALGLARRLDNLRYVATVLQFLGVAHTRAGRPGPAVAALEESLRILRRYQDRYAEVLTLLTLARAHLLRGDRRARGFAAAALAVACEYNLPHHTADALGALGAVELAEGNHALAVRHLESSVRLWRERGWATFLADALRVLGEAQAPVDPGAARRAWREALDIHRGLGHRPKADEIATLIARLDATAGGRLASC